MGRYLGSLQTVYGVFYSVEPVASVCPKLYVGTPLREGEDDNGYGSRGASPILDKSGEFSQPASSMSRLNLLTNPGPIGLI